METTSPQTPSEQLDVNPFLNQYTASLCGELFSYKLEREPCIHHQGGKKMQISYFSAKSRLNLLKILARVDWQKMGRPLFITLTYPNEILPRTAREMSQHRYEFFRYLENFEGKQICSLWRIEWKERQTGAMKNFIYPHYHLLIFNVPFIRHQRINEFWTRAINSPVHVRTDVQKAQRTQKAAFYCAKYASKDSSSLVHAAYLNNKLNGRVWGIVRKNLLTMCSPVTIRSSTLFIAEERLREFKRVFGDAMPFNNESFTCFGEDSLKIWHILFEQCLDGEICTG